jgi:hypothetical protein
MRMARHSHSISLRVMEPRNLPKKKRSMEVNSPIFGVQQSNLNLIISMLTLRTKKRIESR